MEDEAEGLRKIRSYVVLEKLKEKNKRLAKGNAGDALGSELAGNGSGYRRVKTWRELVGEEGEEEEGGEEGGEEGEVEEEEEGEEEEGKGEGEEEGEKDTTGIDGA